MNLPTTSGPVWLVEGTAQRRPLQVMTDAVEYPSRDRVFPLFADENLLLADAVLTGGDRSVLDLGTGAGVFALIAAALGAKVTAVDISGRALAFARHNLLLNRLEDRVELYLGNLYDPLSPGGTFDLIISNPPFVPLPDSHPFHVAGHGGPLGVRVIEPLLREAGQRLSPGGMVAIICLSLQRGAHWLVADMAARLLPPSFRTRVLPVYPELLPLIALYEAFGIDEVARELSLQGYQTIGYGIVAASEDARRLARLEVPPVSESRFAGSWERRLERYRYWRRVSLP